MREHTQEVVGLGYLGLTKQTVAECKTAVTRKQQMASYLSQPGDSSGPENIAYVAFNKIRADDSGSDYAKTVVRKPSFAAW